MDLQETRYEKVTWLGSLRIRCNGGIFWTRRCQTHHVT